MLKCTEQPSAPEHLQSAFLQLRDWRPRGDGVRSWPDEDSEDGGDGLVFGWSNRGGGHSTGIWNLAGRELNRPL